MKAEHPAGNGTSDAPKSVSTGTQQNVTNTFFDMFTCGGKTQVELPKDDRPVSEFAEDLAKAFITNEAPLFARSREVLVLNKMCDGLEPLTSRALRSFAEKYAYLYVCRKRFDDYEKVQRSMSLNDAATVLSSIQFIDMLPQCKLVNSVGLPVLRRNGRIEILPDGYDPESEVYTTGGLSFDLDLPLEEAKTILHELFAEFPWADDGRSFSVQLACMLTVFASGLLPSKTQRPCFIYTANAEGSGKSLLALIVTIVILGTDQVKTLATDETEIRKRLLADVIEGRPVILLDNLKGHLDSPSLEGFLTGPTWSDRVLGKSQNVQAEKVCTTMITGNTLSVSPDIRRRSLWIELFLDSLRSETREIKNPMEVSDIYAMRPKILAALWAFVREWDRADRPCASKIHNSFIQWSRIIGGILENAGFESPTQTPELRKGGDTVTKDLEELGQLLLHTPEEGTTFEEIVEVCLEHGLFDFMLSDCFLKPAENDARGRQYWFIPPRVKSKFGKFLANQDERLIGPSIRLHVIGKGHSRRFYIGSAAK